MKDESTEGEWTRDEFNKGNEIEGEMIKDEETDGGWRMD